MDKFVIRNNNKKDLPLATETETDFDEVSKEKDDKTPQSKSQKVKKKTDSGKN